MLEVKNAIVSVYDKNKVVEFAKGLKNLGVNIISTGGTAEILKDNGIKVVDISEYTESPEMLKGRVKTLHPKIHAGILALKNDKEHMQQLERQKIVPIDMVIVNLYPFSKVSSIEDVELGKVLENIDIGGPTMLRAAAKNYKNVAAVCSIDLYDRILEELRKNNNMLENDTLLNLAVKTFKLTSNYDSLINEYLKNQIKDFKEEYFVKEKEYKFRKVFDLRYGENPHQKAAFYKTLNSNIKFGVPFIKKLHGKELSYNNILDVDAALESCISFIEPAVSIIKHTNPCGIAIGKNIINAFEDALACDPMSAFGSIMGFNRLVNVELAKLILKGFVECIIAPGYEKKALELLKTKQNIRLLKFDQPNEIKFDKFDFKKINGGLLIQDRNVIEVRKEDLKVVTQKKPTEEQIESMLFGFKVIKFVKSNAIVITSGKKTVGLGIGQPSRVDAVKIAVRKAKERAEKACLISDAFFPMPDSIEVAADAGIEAIIQPGGSIRDKEVIKVADKLGISMVFTGIRQFKH